LQRQRETWPQLKSQHRDLPYDIVLPRHGAPGGKGLDDAMIDDLDFAESAVKQSTATEFTQRILARFPDFKEARCSITSFGFCFPDLGSVVMRSAKRLLVAVSVIAALACRLGGVPSARAQNPAASEAIEPLDAPTLDEIRALYRKLIEAENRHDLAAVRTVVWDSPSMLFVAKTATPEEGNWTGFWGTDIVMQHLADIYSAGPFRIDPDYARVKVVGLTRDVAETYAPVKITVAYAGQTPVPKPFLMILNWIHTPKGWRMATDIALPIPPGPHS